MTDFAELRRVMVDTQIRPSDVTKFTVIDAMLKVSRERFVPDARRATAYVEDMIELAPGRAIVEPRTLAKMLDVLNIQPDEMVLDLGCAQGYSTAVIAQMAQIVVGVEDLDGIPAEAQSALMESDVDNAIIHDGPLAEGAPEHGPYDVIVAQGGVEDLPAAILSQLKDGGRIACIMTQEALGSVMIGHKIGDRVTWRFAFNATAPVLPGFARTRIFSL
jgi:protein-L-isoaspartate(D-aspartate) O-methyltransferase